MENEMMQENDKVLDAAMQLVERCGADFSMDELAGIAGVSRTTLYRAVASKENLLKLLASERGVELVSAGNNTRERVLEAAKEVFGRHGLEAATMEDVACHAGVSAMTVYRLFRTKEGLLTALLEERSPRRVARALKLRKGQSLEECLAAFATETLISLRDNAGLLHIVLSASPERWHMLKRLRDAPRGSTAALRNFFSEQMKQGRLAEQDPQRLAVAFSGLLLTYAYIAPRFQGVPLEDAKETGRFVAELFLDGAATIGYIRRQR